LKEKLGLKPEEEPKAEEIDAPKPKGHEIATIRIPGIESGDRAAQDMVNHQAKAKKELNAELKEHAGHCDHLAPSEIVGHATPHELTEVARVDTILSVPPELSSETRQVLAKSEVNAAIKEYAADTSLPDQILPSEVWDHPQADKLAGFLATSDPVMREHIVAKKNLNDEIHQQAEMGHTDQIVPSEINARDRLAGLGAMNDDVMKEHILAKKDLNAEIKDHIGTWIGQTDHIVPSEIAAETKTYHEKHPEKHLTEGFPPEVSTETVTAPVIVHTPEVVEEHHVSTKEKLKGKVKNAAHSIKETFKGLH